MADDCYGSTIAKRRLARRLNELRTASGYTANQVCDRLSWGRGKVGRFEANHWRRPEMSDLRDLMRIYEVAPDERGALEELALLARRRPWWREYEDVFGKDNEFPGYEHDAAKISVYMPLVLPGLLQTPAYIDALMGVSARPERWLRRAREARLRRQAVLGREDGTAPELDAVITEASLMYRWGSRADRRAQLAHLVETGRRPGVRLRLLRFEDGLHPGLVGPVNIFEFPGGDPPVIYLETDLALQMVTPADAVRTYREIFARAWEAALEPAATTAHLKRLANSPE